MALNSLFCADVPLRNYSHSTVSNWRAKKQNATERKRERANNKKKLRGRASCLQTVLKMFTEQKREQSAVQH